MAISLLGVIHVTSIVAVLRGRANINQHPQTKTKTDQKMATQSSSAASLSASVTSLRSSLSLLDSSISILDAGIADFPRLKTVLSSTRVRVPLLFPPSLPNGTERDTSGNRKQN